jgi:hypothetical protein
MKKKTAEAGLELAEPAEYEERVLAEMVGIQRTTLRDARQKLPRDRWEMLGPVLCLTETGVREILTALGLPLPEKSETAAVDMQRLFARMRMEQRRLATLQKLRGRYAPCTVREKTGNDKIVLAEAEGVGGRVRLIVSSGRALRVGDLVTGRHTSGDVWTMEEWVGRAL